MNFYDPLHKYCQDRCRAIGYGFGGLQVICLSYAESEQRIIAPGCEEAPWQPTRAQAPERTHRG